MLVGCIESLGMIVRCTGLTRHLSVSVHSLRVRCPVFEEPPLAHPPESGRAQRSSQPDSDTGDESVGYEKSTGAMCGGSDEQANADHQNPLSFPVIVAGLALRGCAPLHTYRWQVPELVAGRGDQLANAGDVVRRQVVCDDDVARMRE